jgi:hypothetical protein
MDSSNDSGAEYKELSIFMGRITGIEEIALSGIPN